MQIAQLKLVRSSTKDPDWVDPRTRKNMVCACALEKFFNVPKSANTLWLVAHTTSTKNRLAVRRVDRARAIIWSAWWESWLGVPLFEAMGTSPARDMVVNVVGDGEFYLEVWYE